MGAGPSTSVKTKSSKGMNPPKAPTVAAPDETRGKPYTMPNGQPAYLTTRGKLYCFQYACPHLKKIDFIENWDDATSRSIYKLVRVDQHFTSVEAEEVRKQNQVSAFSAMRRRKGEDDGSTLSREEMLLELDSDDYYRASRINVMSMVSNDHHSAMPVFSPKTVTMRVTALSAEETVEVGSTGEVIRKESVTEGTTVALSRRETQTWSFFNDSVTEFFFIRGVFDATSEIRPLQDTRLSRGVTDEIQVSSVDPSRAADIDYYKNLWVAVAGVGPLETIGFIEGHIKGAYSLQIYRCANTNGTDLSELYHLARPKPNPTATATATVTPSTTRMTPSHSYPSYTPVEKPANTTSTTGGANEGFYDEVPRGTTLAATAASSPYEDPLRASALARHADSMPSSSSHRRVGGNPTVVSSSVGTLSNHSHPNALFKILPTHNTVVPPIDDDVSEDMSIPGEDVGDREGGEEEGEGPPLEEKVFTRRLVRSK